MKGGDDRRRTGPQGLSDAFGFEGAEFGGPLLALVFGGVRVREQAASGAIDQGLEGLIAAGFFYRGGDMIVDQFQHLLEVEGGSFPAEFGFEFGAERSEASRGITGGDGAEFLYFIRVEAIGENGFDHPLEEGFAVSAFGIERWDDEITDSAGAAEVRGEEMDAGGDEEPDDFAAHLGVGHHGLDFSGEASFGFVSVRADAAELSIGFIDEDEDFGEGVEDAAEAFEDDVGLAEPLAADVFEDEHHHIEF